MSCVLSEMRLDVVQRFTLSNLIERISQPAMNGVYHSQMSIGTAIGCLEFHGAYVAVRSVTGNTLTTFGLH